MTPLNTAFLQLDLQRDEVLAELTIGNVLVVAAPDGWDDVKRLVGRTLLHEGNRYGYSGWNSDRNEAYFKPVQSFATIL